MASAEKIGLASGLSPFVIGVVIVGVGTSFPEVISSLAAVIKGVTEIIPANAVGSNIANILLVVGLSAIVGRRLVVTKDLIDIDLPLLAVSTVVMLGILADKQVTFFEAVILLFLYVVYLNYTARYSEEQRRPEEVVETLPSRSERRKLISVSRKKLAEKFKHIWKDLLLASVGLLALLFGAKYLIDSVVNLSEILKIGVGAISIVAISLGTSLPELFVSVRAAYKKKHELALGTVFGSNVFNALVVLGLPALFATVRVDAQTFAIGLPAMALATLLFIISGISRRIYIWEGFFYVALYILFVAKIFNLF